MQQPTSATRTPRTIDDYQPQRFPVEDPASGPRHWVYRPPASGPPVIVIHEAMGLTRSTLGVARHVREAGMTPILPLLAGPPLPGFVRGLGVFATVCVKREFGALARGEATPTAEWLRALVRHEAGEDQHPVGVIGMCFSGGYALAAALDPRVKAVVASQPAFPIAIGPNRRRFGVNRDDYDKLRQQTDDGACVRALRYQRDGMSPGARHDALREVLPDATFVEICTWNPLDHPVLSDAVRARKLSPLGKSLSETIAFLRERLVG